MRPKPITFTDWGEALLDAKKQAIEKPPKGWLTIQQIAKKLHYTTCHARNQINPLIGKTVDREKFRVLTGTGTIRLVFHYKLK